MLSIFLAVTLTVTLIGGSVWLGISSNILRDRSKALKPPFSFSRLQLFWWVLIIAVCFIEYFGSTYTLPVANGTCLVLIGIGVGTKSIASVIDSRQRTAAELHGVTSLNEAKTQGFFTDILSDEEGLSVHRLQALIFNVIYGVAFYVAFVKANAFLEYGSLEYLMLGISDVTYLGLKALENDPKELVRHTEVTSGDELLDADDPQGGTAALG